MAVLPNLPNKSCPMCGGFWCHRWTMSLLADEGFLSQSRKNGKIDRWMDIFDKIRVIFGERKDKSKKGLGGSYRSYFNYLNNWRRCPTLKKPSIIKRDNEKLKKGLDRIMLCNKRIEDPVNMDIDMDR